MKVLIVGGVAGGASTAARLRRLDEESEIIVFEKSGYISYANCGLPYYIGEVIKEKEKLVLQTPESMKEKFNLDVRINNEVIAIFPETKEIEIKDLKENRIYREKYDKLVLSPGAEPIRPNIPGINAENIFTLRKVEDTFAIKDFITKNKPKEALIVGGGYIGLEMLENIKTIVDNVTLVELADQVLGILDNDMAVIVQNELISKKIEIILSDGVKSFTEKGGKTQVELNSGKTITADIVVLAIGVKPDIRLAQNAGLKIGGRGGIEVDRFLRTSDPDIYALGDAAEVSDLINENPAIIPLAGPANKQGRIAADNIAGGSESYEGSLGTSILKVFDLTVATVGNSEKVLKKYEINYEKIYIHPPSHAGYYPGAMPMTMKLIFDNHSGKVLGAQIIGYEGVDKRIDVLAAAIKANMTVFDLEKLELSYAPPYSSAKDPINMAGFVASNLIKGLTEIIHWDEIENLDLEKNILVDVRTPLEFSLGHLEGAVNIPHENLRQRMDEIPKDKAVILYCQVGARAYFAERILKENGYDDVKNLSGGYKTYIYQSKKHSNNLNQRDDIIKANNDLRASTCTSEECRNREAIKVDACGLQCPGPIMRVSQTMQNMETGEVLEIQATDPAFEQDIKAWCDITGNRLVEVEKQGINVTATIEKGIKNQNESTQKDNQALNEKTIVVFSGDLDKAIASLIIANGAAAMGSKVTMFFTFWGLNILRRDQRVRVKKTYMEKMFGSMMPRGASKLKLSKMNMGGIGSRLIKHIMKAKNVDSLEELIEKAKAQGVKMIACSMSTDVMGLKKEEFIDGVEIGGVATFLASADRSNMSLFI